MDQPISKAEPRRFPDPLAPPEQQTSNSPNRDKEDESDELVFNGSSDTETTELRVRTLLAQADKVESAYDPLGSLYPIERAIEYRNQALALSREDHPTKPYILGALGASFRRRFRRLGNITDIDQAIAYQTLGVTLTAKNHVDKAALLDELGNSFRSRFESLGNIEDVEQAIECRAQAVQLTPDGHLDKPGRLSNLGNSRLCRFECLGKLEDAEIAIRYQIQAIQLTPEGHPHRPGLLNTLGSAHFRRFERLGELVDLDKAIDYRTQAVKLTPDGNGDRPNHLNNLGNSWQCRFDRFGELPDLDKAIKYQTQAVQLTPNDHADQPGQLNNLGNSWLSRFESLGNLEDIEIAIQCQTQAVQLIPEGHIDRPGLLNNLGSSLQHRFQRLGELADVDKAIEFQSQAVQLTPDSRTSKPGRLNNLGGSYLRRFERLGELADLGKAIDFRTQAVQLTPEGHGDRPSMLNGLGGAHFSRFQRLGELADLDKAIDCRTQAVQLTPEDHADKPSWLNNLGNSLRSRFERLGNLADVDKAIECQTQAVKLTPNGHAGRPDRLRNLGGAHMRRFQRLGELTDIDTAIDCRTRAVLLTPEGHAGKPNQLSTLGGTYLARFQRHHYFSDMESARSSFQRAAELDVTQPETQLQCSRNWARLSKALGLSPLKAYERSIALIPRLIWVGTTIHRRYTLLREISTLATEAAAYAFSANLCDVALEWLEEGRSVVWNQILQLRTPFDNLSVVDPKLAKDLKETATQLESAGSGPAATASSEQLDLDLERQARHHRALATKWEQLVAKAREIRGFHNFMRSRKAAELKHAATDGPVVLLNIHSSRCDALIIFPDCGDVAHRPLDKFSLDTAVTSRATLVSLVGDRGEKNRRPIPLKQTTKPKDIASVLATLWSDVVNPVLDEISRTLKPGTLELPHVTWCCTGPLSFLPLHATGQYDGSSPNAFDLVVSSYTPTLSALITQNTPIPKKNPGLLAIGQAQFNRGFSALPKTVDELAVIQRHAKANGFQKLDGAHASVDAVLSAMNEHSWVHLACHGSQDHANPAQSAFHLWDGDLTLETITKHEFKDKGLAFLSACQTATGDDNLPDESVHLAAGMLMAGYPSVIATMWSIMDNDGPEIAGSVYAELLKGGSMNHREAARALHKAVAELRGTVGLESFTRWVPFIHLGV